MDIYDLVKCKLTVYEDVRRRLEAADVDGCAQATFEPDSGAIVFLQVR